MFTNTTTDLNATHQNDLLRQAQTAARVREAQRGNGDVTIKAQFGRALVRVGQRMQRA